MRTRCIPSCVASLFLLIAATNVAAQSLDWARRDGGLNNDEGQAVAVDGEGNSYVIGTFGTQATFGAGEANETVLNSVCCIASQDIFVAKYAPGGALLWARGIGGSDPSSGGDSGEDRGWGIAVDGQGNSYVTGFLFRFSTFVDFGNGVTLQNTGGGVFVAKYDANGNAAWARHLGPGEGWAIDVDPIGNSYVTGHLPDPTLGGEIPTTWKLDSSGTVVWQRQAPGGSGRGLGVSVDSGGNGYVTGRFGGSTIFGLGEANQTTLNETNGGSGEGYVAKYDSLGNLVWAKQFVSIASWGEAIDTDTGGNSYVTGPFNGTITLGSAPNEATLGAQQVGDMFVAKYDSSGGLLWARQVTRRE